jgi:hypothetical protein
MLHPHSLPSQLDVPGAGSPTVVQGLVRPTLVAHDDDMRITLVTGAN